MCLLIAVVVMMLVAHVVGIRVHAAGRLFAALEFAALLLHQQSERTIWRIRSVLIDGICLSETDLDAEAD